MSLIVPGLRVDNIISAMIVVAILGIVNMILWPILAIWALPFLVYTMGIGALLFQGVIIWLASKIVPGITITGWALLVTPIGLSTITLIVYALPGLDDDLALRARYTTYFRYVLDSREDGEPPAVSKGPGVILLEIDGLAEPILRAAIKRGDLPTLAGWLEDGSHRLARWETDLSSQTGSSQAGILHGNNNNIPSYRWYERESGKIIVTSKLADAPELEKRISNGHGLLARNGASRANLFSGDAKDTFLTYSRLDEKPRLYTRAWYFFYSNPNRFARTLGLIVWDILLETKSRIRQWKNDVQPRMHRTILYYGVRAVAAVLMRELTTYTVIGDIITGRPDIVYASFCAYDEVAHHSGPWDEDGFIMLRQLDEAFARIERVRKIAERQYRIVVLSDHGQSYGSTFKQRTGITLGELVHSLVPEEYEMDAELYRRGSRVSDVIAQPVDKLKTFWPRLSTLAKIIVPGPKRKMEEDPGKTKTSVVILGSGNMGLTYFPNSKERLTLEEIERSLPKLIPGLLENEWVGFVCVMSRKDGPVVIGRKGTNYLELGRIEGQDPLRDYGHNAAMHILRETKFSNAPDIMILSKYDKSTDQVAAFEELIGSHGGIGGSQSDPFILYPSEWGGLKRDELIGAEKLHRLLIEKINETLGRDDQSGEIEPGSFSLNQTGVK